MRCLVPKVTLLCLIISGSSIEPLCSAPLDFASAWQRVCSSEQLGAATFAVEEKKGELVQTGLWPNPLLSIETEKAGGSRAFRRWNDAEVSCTLSQLVPIPAKRHSRCELARSYVASSAWEKEVLMHQLYYDLAEAFIATAIAEEKLKCVMAFSAIADTTATTTSQLLACGKLTLLQRQRSSLRCWQIQLQCQELQYELESTKLALAGLWGSDQIDFEEIIFPLNSLTPPPLLAELLADLSTTPQHGVAAAAVTTAAAGVRNAYSERYPDCEVSVGYSGLGRGREQTYALAVTVPVPLFDRNQGGVYSAQAKLARTEQEALWAAREQRTALTQAHLHCLNAYRQAELHQQELLTEANALVAATQESYSYGKLSHFELFEAQAQLFEEQLAALNALYSYHHAKLALARLSTPSPRPIP